MDARGDGGVTLADLLGKIAIDDVEFGDVDVQAERMQLGDKGVETVTVDRITALDMPLQPDAMQRDVTRQKIPDKIAKRVALVRRRRVFTLDVIFVDDQFGIRIRRMRCPESNVDISVAEILQPDVGAKSR